MAAASCNILSRVYNNKYNNKYINTSRRLLLLHAVAHADSDSTTTRTKPKLETITNESGNFDFTALVASVTEIAQKIPTKVLQCMQPDPHTLILSMRTIDDELLKLHCSSHPNFARVCFSPTKNSYANTPSKKERLSFGERANDILREKILIKVRIPVKFERVAVFSFGERVGEEGSTIDLICEVMGRKSNIIIVDGKTNIILACSHQIGEKQSQVRNVVLGKLYAFPPDPPGIDPGEVVDAKSFRETIESENASGNLSKAFRGVSPALERTLRTLATNLEMDGSEKSLDYDRFFEEFVRWRSSINEALARSTSETEKTMESASDAATYFNPYTKQILLHETLNSVRVQNKLIETSLGTLFSEMYEEKSNENVYESERNDCLKAVKIALQKSTNKMRAFEKQIKAGEKHDEMSLEADAIIAYASQYKKNEDIVNGFDFETGEPKAFKVDKELGAIGTAEALYKKARKLRRTADAVLPLIEDLKQDTEYLEQVEFSLRELSLDDDENNPSSVVLDDKIVLEEIKIELVRANLMKPRDKQSMNEVKSMNKNNKNGNNKNNKQSRKEQLMSGVRTYAAPSGKVILCGRNSRGNEAVSLHLSQPQDVWFHVRGAPGSHVVLRQQPGTTASDEDMQFAADLAAFHSKSRNDGKVQVSYTSPKNVRKPSGVSRLGMVTISSEKVWVARPENSVAYLNGETGGAQGDEFLT